MLLTLQKKKKKKKNEKKNKLNITYCSVKCSKDQLRINSMVSARGKIVYAMWNLDFLASTLLSLFKDINGDQKKDKNSFMAGHFVETIVERSKMHLIHDSCLMLLRVIPLSGDIPECCTNEIFDELVM